MNASGGRRDDSAARRGRGSGAEDAGPRNFLAPGERRRLFWIVMPAGMLLLALLGTLPLTLTLPENAYRVAPRDWPDAARRFELIGAETSAQFSAALLALPGHDRILTDYAGMPRALVGTGVTTVPFWSPEVAWLFDEKTPSAEVARRWRASGIRYVVTSPSPPFLDFLHRHARWTAPPFALLPVWNSEAYVILEVIQEPPAAK